MLIVVHSCCENAELRRLGRREWTVFCFCTERLEVLAEDPGVVGELEYDEGDDGDDEEEPTVALDVCRRWQWSYSMAGGAGAGMVIEEDILQTVTKSGGEALGGRSRR